MCSAQFDFTDEEIRTLPEGHLLSMEIEFSRRCNYRCPYCYAAGDYDYSNELTKDEIRSTLAQAAELGARKIVILGGTGIGGCAGAVAGFAGASFFAAGVGSGF